MLDRPGHGRPVDVAHMQHLAVGTDDTVQDNAAQQAEGGDQPENDSRQDDAGDYPLPAQRDLPILQQNWGGQIRSVIILAIAKVRTGRRRA